MKTVKSSHSFCFARLPWRQLLGLVADIAQDGFNVTYDLGECFCRTRGMVRLDYVCKKYHIFFDAGQCSITPNFPLLLLRFTFLQLYFGL